jgi:uracil-DNA glycosylase
MPPRPIIEVSSAARILVAGKAPGTRAHQSGVPFSDPSGDHLREWLGLSADEFHDVDKIAVMPMGFCYPGRLGSGDAPPRPECAPLWRGRLLAQMPELHLTLLVGSYAQAHVLGAGRMGDRVRNFRQYLPKYLPLPHPSWRSRIWAAKNPWFETELLPVLRSAVCDAIA